MSSSSDSDNDRRKSKKDKIQIYEGKSNDATKAQKESPFVAIFRIKNELAELGSPLSDLKRVDTLLRSLPTQVCYNELRRKVLFSSNMGKHTPDLVRELILTTEARSKGWEKSAFGNNQGKTKPGKAWVA
ncbi:hypothetical protein JG688_00013016 [Phytophthora aleatoria]|uniref:Uncharacterized protein n=1 Tax=Phytophthora aleatoria TaxID=2496075 RepID=A0A8J5I9Y2_9STRA|nr:hypothetical protein JG688_00013016 [Phytophthora aleatoria]